MSPVPVLISAGEASGDMYAARLARALSGRADVALFGMGGPQMREAGVEVVAPFSAVVGFSEVLRHLPELRRTMRRLVSEARTRKPPIAILTDYPSFHLRLARRLQAQGIRNVYFVCPQFWAWRPWRARVVRRRFALGLCIFAFEEKFYRDAGVQAEFIGHPLVGEVRASKNREEFCRDAGLNPAAPVVTVLPGSRGSEQEHHLPILREACALVHAKVPAQFVVAAAPGSDVRGLQQGWPAGLEVRVVQGQTYNALAAADAAVVSSGTATVETALLDTPMVVVYRVAKPTALLVRPLLRAPFICMVNLIAGRSIVPELIQDNFRPERVAQETLALLESPEKRRAMRQGLAEVRERLGPPGAVDRAAEAIVPLLEKRASNTF